MRTLMILPALVTLSLIACTPPVQTGQQLFQDYCASCHGDDARGTSLDFDGKMPPDLTTLSKRHSGEFPTQYVMSTIDGYSRAVTHGAMPQFGALIDSETETWTDAKGVPTPTPVALIKLAEYLEGLQR